MSETTKIQWADHTFNPWRGCTKVSEGCRNCYAETMSKRNPAVLGEWGPAGKRAIAAESYWRLPFQWDAKAGKDGVRRRVFCASLADVFEDRPELEAPRARLFDLIEKCVNLDWLLLTKRPENISKFRAGRKYCKNVWLGTSAEDQETADVRIPRLFNVWADVWWVSYEPALGPVDFTPYLKKNQPRLDWIVVGGESGPGARPFKIDWAHRTIQQCKSNEVAVFMKQMGAKPYREGDDWTTCFDGTPLYFKLNDPKGGDPDEWSEEFRVREFPGGGNP